jgi:hypothetical protein
MTRGFNGRRSIISKDEQALTQTPAQMNRFRHLEFFSAQFNSAQLITKAICNIKTIIKIIKFSII